MIRRDLSAAAIRELLGGKRVVFSEYRLLKYYDGEEAVC
jgi:hypothetical protein